MFLVCVASCVVLHPGAHQTLLLKRIVIFAQILGSPSCACPRKSPSMTDLLASDDDEFLAANGGNVQESRQKKKVDVEFRGDDDEGVVFVGSSPGKTIAALIHSLKMQGEQISQLQKNNRLLTERVQQLVAEKNETAA